MIKIEAMRAPKTLQGESRRKSVMPAGGLALSAFGGAAGTPIKMKS